MKIGLYCVLESLTTSYSLCEVLVDQARMLLRGGHTVLIWMLQGWDLERDPVASQLQREYFGRLHFQACVPRLRLYDYDPQEPLPLDGDADDPVRSFAQKCAAIGEAMYVQMRLVDLVITHDLLFQAWYLPHGSACHAFAREFPHLRWLHWQHSASGPVPEPRPAFPHSIRWEPMPNARFVFVNDDPREREIVATARGIPTRQLAFVPNTRDVMEYFDFDPATKTFVRAHDLLAAELLLVMPARLCEGKQPKRALLALAAFRRQGIDARLVWCAAYSPPQEEKHARYLAELHAFAAELDIPAHCFLVTCQANDDWRLATPRRVVRDLQQIADLFVLPSLSEAHSLVAMEAALARQVLVLNEDFPAMAGAFPSGSCYQWHFCSNRMTTEYHGAGQGEGLRVGHDPQQSELAYYGRKATSLLYDLQYNPAWRAFSFVKRERNFDYVRMRYLEPLISSVMNMETVAQGG